MVSRRQLECPRCKNVFPLAEKQWTGEVACPSTACGWRISYEKYHDTWRHQDLLAAGKALDAVEEYQQQYEADRTPQERMLCIDHLLHTFHWDARLDLPNRTFANNLIHGSHKEVLEFLDRLSFGDHPETKELWRATAELMTRRRRGLLSTKPGK
jgi:hypothetical protein